MTIDEMLGRLGAWARRTERADAARLAALRERFPRSLVLRSRAEKRFRRSLARFPHGREPRRDGWFSLVATVDGIALFAGIEAPFLRLAWEDVAGVRMRAIDDYLVPDLYTAEGGYVTHLLWIAVGGRALELEVWGDPAVDGTGALFDEYGLGPIVARLERLRRSSARPT
ncbi:hypothetical protein QT381_14425 [Galbitalea sp. SE-J8]|uniref:hypothetical protein n=1 Tax=Galbitalea sp. SE-J8 TaxID=3054952 RepID=UPI00259CAE98|nr:hypothetical protein [Galbitalea sp. SE-J8]MDM4764201.1 hypothetical protein [Galbitalea sp. SE-J8]